MNKIKIICLLLSLSFFTGCGNFSPLNRQRINNQGSLEDIKSNQSGLMAEVGKLKQDAEILNSQLKEIQSGLVNLNNILSKNENSGVQILQGDGALILVFSLVTLGMILFYRNKAVQNEKNLNILAKEFVNINDPNLNEQILRSAMEQKTGESMLKALKKNL